MKYIITETQYRFLKEEEIKLRRRINQIEELIDDEINDVMSTSGGFGDYIMSHYPHDDEDEDEYDDDDEEEDDEY